MMIYLILGMHKSGTTLLAKTLHQSGINMVDVEPEGDYEADAFYERKSTYEVNLRLLDWRDDEILFHRPPKAMNASDIDRQTMQTIIQKADHQHVDWGFKDPRTCLTYFKWEETLPEHRLIIIFRPIESIWHRFQYDGLRFWKNWVRAIKLVETWCIYNQAILDIMRQTSHDYFITDYDSLLHDAKEFQRLSIFLDKPLVDVRQKRNFKAKKSNLVLRFGIAYGVYVLSLPYQTILDQLDDARKRQSYDKSHR